MPNALSWVGSGQFLQVMTEIARSGQQWRLAILIARVTRDHLEGRQRIIDRLLVLFGKLQLEQAKIIFYVHVLTESRANNNASDRVLIQDHA